MKRLTVHITIACMAMLVAGCVLPMPVPYRKRVGLHTQVKAVYLIATNTLHLESYEGSWSTIPLDDLPVQNQQSACAHTRGGAHTVRLRDFQPFQPSEIGDLLSVQPLSMLSAGKPGTTGSLFSEGVVGGVKYVYRDPDKADSFRVFFVEQKEKKKLTIGVPVVYPDVMEGDLDVDMAPLR